MNMEANNGREDTMTLDSFLYKAEMICKGSACILAAAAVFAGYFNIYSL